MVLTRTERERTPGESTRSSVGGGGRNGCVRGRGDGKKGAYNNPIVRPINPAPQVTTPACSIRTMPISAHVEAQCRILAHPCRQLR